MIKKQTRLGKAFLYTLFIVGFASCSGFSDNESGEDESGVIEDFTNETTASANVTVAGEVFNIPSPIRTALTVKESGASIDMNSLHDPSLAMTYNTELRRALNLGIFGADIGFATIYGEKQKSLKMLKSIHDMSDDLDISGAFSAELVERFSNNMDSQDSVLSMVAEAYALSDAYLKENNRENVAGLILAGGWLESMFIACQAASAEDNPKLMETIGEQKSTLDRLIKMLSKLIDSQEFSDLVQDFEDLYVAFEGVEESYVFSQSEIKADSKLCLIKSKNVVTVDKASLDQIYQWVKEIRSRITG